MTSTLVKSFLFFGFLEVILTGGFAQESIPEFLCDGVPVDQYVRNVTDCRSWIKCKADRIVSGYCPEPYFFDQLHQYCSRIENVECFSCPNSTALLEYFPVANSCNRFIRCLRGVAKEFICDPGLQFNNSTKQCQSDVVCTPSESLQCPSNLKPGEFYAINDSGNCSIGLVCIGDPEPLPIECSGSLHFDPVSLMCVNPENSGCADPNTTTSAPTPAPATTIPTTTTDPEAPPSETIPPLF